MQENRTAVPHQLIMQDRKTLEMTGVSDLSNYDDNTLVVTTSMGELTLRGRGLNVRHLNLESGSLSVEGTIESLAYSEPIKGGWLSRLLR